MVVDSIEFKSKRQFKTSNENVCPLSALDDHTNFSDKIVTIENVVINQRVRRGIDWNFNNQDCQNGLGTVVGPIKDGWVGIRWDNGNWHMYPISSYSHSMLGYLTEHSLYIA